MYVLIIVFYTCLFILYKIPPSINIIIGNLIKNRIINYVFSTSIKNIRYMIFFE